MWRISWESSNSYYVINLIHRLRTSDVSTIVDRQNQRRDHKIKAGKVSEMGKDLPERNPRLFRNEQVW